ncbi:MAG TPA: 4-hydroxy-3-methylbut-2-enyl diphosphate reductase [Synergistales bacterium]|nr:4-hydroxy-3-methylbut-2-enyl diphosphate reductase [Synergistales bacterium]HRV71401.1 4-hydroxy-3-methylbut-2-enyl diphosphate reductase [Thermovirgaceae bacterium]
MENKTFVIPRNTELVFAEPRGFCFGVRRAISTLEEALAKFGRVYALGSPIHNSREIERLRSMGLEIVEDPSEIPQGGVVFIRAHGVSDRVVEHLTQKEANIIDGTCPFVRKAQERATFLAEEGYHVIILGDKEHPEVRAIREFARGPVTVVDPFDILPAGNTGASRIGIVSQTTQRRESLSSLVSFVCARTPEVRVFNTICGATASRQDAVATLADKVDGIIVTGGKNSANTAKLVEICENAGTPVLWIEDEGEMESGWFRDKRTIGIAAGASTPDWLIHRLETKLASAKSAREDEWEDD